MDETVSTLRFGRRAKLIKNVARVNQVRAAACGAVPRAHDRRARAAGPQPGGAEGAAGARREGDRQARARVDGAAPARASLTPRVRPRRLQAQVDDLEERLRIANAAAKGTAATQHVRTRAACRAACCAAHSCSLARRRQPGQDALENGISVAVRVAARAARPSAPPHAPARSPQDVASLLDRLEAERETTAALREQLHEAASEQVRAHSDASLPPPRAPTPPCRRATAPPDLAAA